MAILWWGDHLVTLAVMRMNQRFSNLWRFSGGATLTPDEQKFFTDCFSNLWRFSGGATRGAEAGGTQKLSFSNLWRFSGGATFNKSY